MIITYYGLQAFRIQPKNNEDGVIFFNPFHKKIGIKIPKQEVDIILLSNLKSPNNDTSSINNKPFTIDCAGEYDIKNIGVKGIEIHNDKNKKNVIFKIIVDGVSIVHLGELTTKLETRELEEIGSVDILMVPVSKTEEVNPVEAISKIEPRIIIPMSYKVPGIILELKNLDNFIQEIGSTPTNEDKLKITKKDLPQDETELVVLGVK